MLNISGLLKVYKGFSELAYTITSLTKEGGNISVRGDDAVKSFAKLKQCFHSAPVCIQPNLN